MPKKIEEFDCPIKFIEPLSPQHLVGLTAISVREANGLVLYVTHSTGWFWLEKLKLKCRLLCKGKVLSACQISCNASFKAHRQGDMDESSFRLIKNNLQARLAKQFVEPLLEADKVGIRIIEPTLFKQATASPYYEYVRCVLFHTMDGLQLVIGYDSGLDEQELNMQEIIKRFANDTPIYMCLLKIGCRQYSFEHAGLNPELPPELYYNHWLWQEVKPRIIELLKKC